MLRLPLYLFLAFFFLIAPPSAFGADERVDFFLSLDNPNAIVGEFVRADITIKSPSPSNAFRVPINYPSDMLEFVQFETEGSVIDIWHTTPKATGPFEIVGGATRPWSGESGKIGTLVFRALHKGIGSVRLAKTEAYWGDGTGTKAETNTAEQNISVIEGIPRGVPSNGVDNAPPLVESISVIDDPFNVAQKLVGISTRDTASGVREIQARTRAWIGRTDWVPVKNPFAVEKRAWAIAIKTIDYAGNERVETRYDWNAFFFYVLLPAALLIITLFGLWWGLRKLFNH